MGWGRGARDVVLWTVADAGEGGGVGARVWGAQAGARPRRQPRDPRAWEPAPRRELAAIRPPRPPSGSARWVRGLFLPAGVGCGAHRTAGQCCRGAAAVHGDPSLQPGHPGVPIPPAAPRPLRGRRVPCLVLGGGANPWAPGVPADGGAVAHPPAAAVAQRGQSHRHLETSLPPFPPPRRGKKPCGRWLS